MYRDCNFFIYNFSFFNNKPVKEKVVCDDSPPLNYNEINLKSLERRELVKRTWYTVILIINCYICR